MKAIFLLIAMAACAYGQAPKAADKEAPLPATLEIAGADAKTVKDAQAQLELAQLRARNLELEIQQQVAQANKQLEALKKKAEEERQKWQALISTIAKLPIDKLPEYQMVEKDGKWILTRKVEVKP